MISLNQILPPRPSRDVEPDIRRRYPLNLLIAYPYINKDMLSVLEAQPPGTIRLMIDSGAFTAHTQGAKIDHRAYLQFLKSIAHLGTVNAVQLDVIGNPEATYKNLMTAYDAGVEVMPVFTRGEALERLEEFYKLSRYVLLGGVAQGAGNTNYVAWFEKHNQGRPVHWLGFVRMAFLKHYRPMSADSSRWMRGARYGLLDFYGGQGKLLPAYTRAQAKLAPSREIVQAAARVGIGAKELSALGQGASWQGVVSGPKMAALSKGDPLTGTGAAMFMGSLAYVKLSLDAESALKTRYYLACATTSYVQTAIAARDFMIARNVLH